MRITTMEAEVLLEALPEEDCRFDHNRDCQEHGFFGIDGNCPVAESKELISTALKAPIGAESAEPAPVVTAEAVERALDAFVEHRVDTKESRMRAALEVAAPLLGPRPLLDREALYWAISEASERQGVAKFLEEEDVDAFTSAALTLARPMPTQAELADWLRETFTADTIGPTWDLAAECLLIALNGADS